MALEPRTLLSDIYVNSANSGTQDGLSPATGFSTIQTGISSANPGDTILVENGFGYNESDTVDVADLTIDADSGQTPVLDGTNPFPQGSPGFTIESTGVTIAGFTIQNFSGTSGILVQSGASLTVDDCTFVANHASFDGGAIDNAGQLDVLDSDFTSNSAGSNGGAVLYSGSGSGSISGCNFSNNLAGSGGGAISVISGSLTIAGTTFAGNIANDFGGALYFGGPATITNSTFIDDHANGAGGAIDNEGRSTFRIPASPATPLTRSAAASMTLAARPR